MIQKIPVGWLLIIIIILLGIGIGLLWQENQELKAIASTETPQTPIESSVSTVSPSLTINTHTDEIKRIESESGVFLSRVAGLIIRDEGDKPRPYLDSGNTVTIGVGRNLQTNGISVSELHAIVKDIDYKHILNHTHIQNGRVYINSLDVANKIFPNPLTKDDIQLLLTDDLNNVSKEAKQVFGDTWSTLDSVRKEVIVDLLYNLGLSHFKEFVNFIGAVKASDWNKAASELLLSNAARKNIVRYHRNAVVLQTGDETYFELK